MKRLLPFVLLLMVSCQMVPSWLGGGSSDPPAARTDGGEYLRETGNLISEFRWLLLLVLLFIPQARVAVGEFVTTLFRGLTLPLTLLLRRWGTPSGVDDTERKLDHEEEERDQQAPPQGASDRA